MPDDTPICSHCGRTPNDAAFLEGASEVLQSLAESLATLDAALHRRATEHRLQHAFTVVQGGRDDA